MSACRLRNAIFEADFILYIAAWNSNVIYVVNVWASKTNVGGLRLIAHASAYVAIFTLFA